MTVTLPLTIDPALLEKALDWIVFLKAASPTEADADRLLEWRRQSEDHEAAFRAAVNAYRAGQAAVADLFFPKRDDKTPPCGVTTRHRILAGALAAAVSALTVWSPLYLWPSFKQLVTEYMGPTEVNTLRPGTHSRPG